MRVRHFDHFFQMTLFPRFFPVNTYLVHHDDGLIVIDTGLPISGPGIIRTLRSQAKPLTHILLTHGHYDHAGSLDQIAQQFPAAQVACSQAESAMLAGHSWEDSDGRRLDEKNLPGRWARTRVQPTMILEDGEHIGPLQVLASPGHTPGHLSYWHEGAGALFTGDAFQTQGRLAVAGDVIPTFPWVTRATWNQALALRSARQLASLPIQYLATAHGEVLTDPNSRLAAAITRASKRLEGVAHT